jgi:hypothetical protein
MIEVYDEYKSENEIEDNRLIDYIKNNIDFKIPIRDIEMVIKYRLSKYTLFRREWLSIDIFSYIDKFKRINGHDLDPNELSDIIVFFKDNNYSFNNTFAPQNSDYLLACVELDVLDISKVYKSLDYYSVYSNKNLKNKIYEWVLDNDFIFAVNNSYFNLFIKWIVENKQVDKFRNKIIELLEKGLPKVVTEFIIDEIDDDEIEILAAKALIHSRLKKKWQIDFKKFERIKSFKNFKRFNS